MHKNAPFVHRPDHLILFAVIYMFVMTAFVANVIVRDDETGFGPIIRATPIRKFDYLYGRFTGALAAAALAFVAVPLGLWLGSLAPWLDRETLGPFVLARLPLRLRDRRAAGHRLLRRAVLHPDHRHPLDDVDLCRRGRAVRAADDHRLRARPA